MRLHSKDGRTLSAADLQAQWHSVLETVWIHCDEAQQVGCLRRLTAGVRRRHPVTVRKVWNLICVFVCSFCSFFLDLLIRLLVWAPVSSEISDLLFFVSDCASQNKETKLGNYFFDVCCVN